MLSVTRTQRVVGTRSRMLAPYDTIARKPQLSRPPPGCVEQNERRLHRLMLYRPSPMRDRLPYFGYVYVILGLAALAVAGDHPGAGMALYAASAFTLLWFLESLRAKLVRYDPDRFYAGIVLGGGAAVIALEAGAIAEESPELSAVAAACAASVVIGSSLAGLAARKVPRTIGRLGVAGGFGVLAVGMAESAFDWTLAGSNVWASAIGFMVWVAVTATFLLRT